MIFYILDEKYLEGSSCYFLAKVKREEIKLKKIAGQHLKSCIL